MTALDHDFFNISGTVGNGQLAINELGYADPLLTGIVPRHPLPGCVMISAHAPSMLKLVLHRPALVRGFLNCSSRIHLDNPVAFWADFNWLGIATGPGDMTAEVRLEPGEHILQAGCRSDWNEFRHSIWAIKEASARTTMTSNAPGPDNTAVMVVGAYPPNQLPYVLRQLAYSARKQNIWLTVLGVGETYDHYNTRICRLAEWIDGLPAIYRYIVYADARDTLFLQPLDYLCRAFETLASPLVISTEPCCFPVCRADWAIRFPRHPTGRHFPNSGLWMGQRAAVLSALHILRQLGQQLTGATTTEDTKDLMPYDEFHRDDQFLWQAAYLKRLFPLQLDHDGKMMATVSCCDRLIPTNRDFDFDGGKVVLKASGASPGILHFAGPAAQHCRDQWGGYLGAF